MTDAKTPPRPRRHLRRAVIGVLALAALLAGLHAVAWFWATGALAVGFSDWSTSRRAQGWTIRHAAPSRGGWPFAARLTVPGLKVEGWDLLAPAGFTLDSESLDLELSLRRPDRLVIRAEGPQRLATPAMLLPFIADRFEIFAPLDRGGPPRSVTAEASGLRLTLPDGLLEIREARLALTPLRPPADGEPSLHLALSAAGATLPPSLPATALGREVQALSLAAEIFALGPFPGPPQAVARGWRDAGGAVELRSLAFRWNALAGEARLRLTLDQALQPRGSGEVRLAGAGAALERMAGAGLVAEGAARAGQLAVMLMSRPAPDGGPALLEAPLVLEGGVLAVARLPLLRLPPIRWPDTPYPLPR